ncbi:amidohydrolase family protein [Pigmentiphaga sp. YJ18]|uniref:amidohydrolase family protein n=1 Tax=Pigmentiphaga sp. YJ18 TaxID=3134907 RepID=UPI003112560E
MTIPHACDTHFHVFGPADRYPYAGKLRYDPPQADLEDYLAEARALGFSRYVFVQPSAYGQDNRCMLEAMRRMGPDCRGIVDLPDDVPDEQLADLHQLGVRGIRINVNPIAQPAAGLADTLIPRIRRWEARCAATGWQLDFLGPGWLTRELLPTMASLRLPFTVAHLGMNLAADGVRAPGFQALLDFLRHGDGLCFVKLTGSYRISKTPGFGDIAPMVHALLEAAPDHLIWGSDYPHLSFQENSSADLFRLFTSWIPDAALQRQILATTPARLYGWETD